MAKLGTWGDSHWGAIQLQSNSRLPGRHSKAHFSHKDWEKRTSNRPLFFLGILTHILFYNQPSQTFIGHVIKPWYLPVSQRVWWDILMRHFNEKFWWGILIKHLMRHFDETFWWDILMRYFDETFWWDILMRPFDETFWWDILMGHFDETF